MCALLIFFYCCLALFIYMYEGKPQKKLNCNNMLQNVQDQTKCFQNIKIIFALTKFLKSSQMFINQWNLIKFCQYLKINKNVWICLKSIKMFRNLLTSFQFYMKSLESTQMLQNLWHHAKFCQILKIQQGVLKSLKSYKMLPKSVKSKTLLSNI